MSKQLRFTYNEKEYCLEFTRKSVEMMEKQGFVAGDITDKPMTTLPALFAGAFVSGIAPISARAGVHGANQHKIGGEGHFPSRAGNGNAPILQRLAQNLQAPLFKFGQLV